MSAQTMRPLTATTTPTAFWFRSCLITLSYDFCIGCTIDCTCCLTARLSRALAYEVVLLSSRTDEEYASTSTVELATVPLPPPIPAPLPTPVPLPVPVPVWMAGGAAGTAAAIAYEVVLLSSRTEKTTQLR